MERGKWSLEAVFDRAHDWGLAHLPVAPVCLGEAQREGHAMDSSTIARLRAGPRLALAGKGDGHRAGRAVRATIVAALTRVVMIGGGRVGLVRRTRLGSSGHDAVERLCADLPPATGQRLRVVEAGLATKEQCAAATAQDALLGHLRIHTKLRCAPAPPSGNPGRPPVPGEVVHPGRDPPEVVPDVERTLPGEAGTIRLRRWSTLPYAEFPETLLDVGRIDDPAYDVPLRVGATARDVRLEAFGSGSPHRWPVETHFFVAQDTAAMEMPRAWTQTALERRLSLALLVGTLFKAMAAVCTPQAIGPWDRKPVRSAGRLANSLDLHAERFFALALQGVEPRNHRKNPNRVCTKDLRPRKAA
jgi:hypothetical protein